MLITNHGSMWGTVYDDINEMALQLKVGDCLTFGSFLPGTSNSWKSAVRVPMLWHVIDKKESKLKLLSYFFFEHTGYWALQGGSKPVTWEETEIRHDLNNKYFYDCFSENERNAILTTDVKTKVNSSEYIITKDKLYVPALDEIEEIPDHLKIGRDLYADCSSDGIPTLILGYCFYWLRDAGRHGDDNLVVQGYANSKIVLDSLEHSSDEVGVRAVLWVDAGKIGDA